MLLKLYDNLAIKFAKITSNYLKSAIINIESQENHKKSILSIDMYIKSCYYKASL